MTIGPASALRNVQWHAQPPPQGHEHAVRREGGLGIAGGSAEPCGSARPGSGVRVCSNSGSRKRARTVMQPALQPLAMLRQVALGWSEAVQKETAPAVPRGVSVFIIPIVLLPQLEGEFFLRRDAAGGALPNLAPNTTSCRGRRRSVAGKQLSVLFRHACKFGPAMSSLLPLREALACAHGSAVPYYCSVCST